MIKAAILSLLYRTGLLDFYLRSFIKRKKSFPGLVITYHRFAKSYDGLMDVEPAFAHLIKDFENELDFLQRYFRFVSLDDFVDTLKGNRGFSEPTVTLTMDDGYEDNYLLAYPILKERGIPATIFLAARLIDERKNIWIDHVAHIIRNVKSASSNIEDRRLLYRECISRFKEMSMDQRLKEIDKMVATIQGLPAEKHELLNWSQIKEMQQHGISFGAHTCTHPMLTKMPLDQAKEEISDSKKIIEGHVGGLVKHFAFPNGRPQDFNIELTDYCKDIGFQSVSSYNNDGGNQYTEDIWNLRRLAAYSPIVVFIFNILRWLTSSRNQG